MKNDIGEKIYNLANRIFPIYRCLMGDGVKETLSIIAEVLKNEAKISMDVTNVPSGTKVFDWMVPKEWKVREAYIEDKDGNRIIDIKNNNLHLMGYSIAVDRWVDLEELKKSIYTLEDQPDYIPYVTSYYKENYGFCMSKNQFERLKDDKYHIYIDSELFDGNLSYGEVYLPGVSSKEVFFSTYICHPSMANNECSGPALMTYLITYIAKLRNRKYSYRFIFIPETIGSITYMSKNLDSMKKNIIAGFNLTCVGDDREYSIIHTRYANTYADKILLAVLKWMPGFKEYSYLQRGSDERQYNSPKADLPIVTYCRSKFHTYPEYHTSADNMSLVSAEGFQGSFEVLCDVVHIIEANDYYISTVCGEPQLGKRGLYPDVSKKGSSDSVRNIMNFIAYCDGKNDLIDIAGIINISIKEALSIYEELYKYNIIERINR